MLKQIYAIKELRTNSLGVAVLERIIKYDHEIGDLFLYKTIILHLRDKDGRTVRKNDNEKPYMFGIGNIFLIIK